MWCCDDAQDGWGVWLVCSEGSRYQIIDLRQVAGRTLAGKMQLMFMAFSLMLILDEYLHILGLFNIKTLMKGDIVWKWPQCVDWFGLREGKHLIRGTIYLGFIIYNSFTTMIKMNITRTILWFDFLNILFPNGEICWWLQSLVSSCITAPFIGHIVWLPECCESSFQAVVANAFCCPFCLPMEIKSHFLYIFQIFYLKQTKGLLLLKVFTQ